jgi:hypothetical protein
MNMQVLKLMLPKGWEYLSVKNLEYLSQLLISEYEATEIKVLCALKWSGLEFLGNADESDENGMLQYNLRHRMVGEFTLDADRFLSIVDQLDWLEDNIKLFNLPPQLKGYRPLDSRLYGLRADEWFLLDNAYAAFCSTKNFDHLNVMLAIMYRKNGDQWQSAKHLSRWANRFKRLAPHKKYIVFLWYTGVKMWLMEKYWYVFSGSSDSPTPPDEALMAFLAALNDGRMSDNDKIKGSEVHEALYQLNVKIEQSKSLK